MQPRMLPKLVRSCVDLLLIGLDGLRDMQPDVIEFYAQSLPRDTQQSSGLVFIAACTFQDSHQQYPVNFTVNILIKIFCVWPKSLANDPLEIKSGSQRNRGARFSG